MLFNSYEFIFAFLPIAVIGFYLLAKLSGAGRRTDDPADAGQAPRGGLVPVAGAAADELRGGIVRGRALPMAWLAACSLVFYAWWNPIYVVLLLASLCVNYAAGRVAMPGPRPRAVRRAAVVAGVVFNLGLLGYFKYSAFFVQSVNAVIDTGFTIEHIVLPLAISFFTFQQITYLIDGYRGETRDHGVLEYAVFVTFFPQLIAGPIVHHREMMPQFRARATYRFDPMDVSVGLTFFAMGLFKKVVVADSLAPHANAVFDAAERGVAPTSAEGWVAGLVYALQLYFDFSGYSDMAMGLARMFGVRLPVNFDSPLKSRNTGEFWRRWHITLGRFLRDYVYIPMGGSRRGTTRRFINIYTVMILCGFWHGAGWTFVAFGALHATFVAANHVVVIAKKRLGVKPEVGGFPMRAAAWAVTMSAFLLSIILFRAESFGSAMLIINELLGIGPENGFGVGLDTTEALAMAAPLLVWCLLAPNTNAVMSDHHRPIEWKPREEVGHEPMPPAWLRWRPSPAWALLTVGLLVSSVLLLSRANEFLYFQF